jgi:uncharacterized protein YndB with AHSA1/START domain
MKAPPSITYDIYIRAALRQVWHGIVDPELTKHYVYGTSRVGDLIKGRPYQYVADGGFGVVDGKILDIEPEKRLVISWAAHWDEAVSTDRASRVTFELSSPGPTVTKLRVLHDDFEGATATYTGSVDGWPLMLSGLKSLLETGKPLSTDAPQ